MKLFLSSIAISESQVDAFAGLVGKPAHDITIGLIEDAATCAGEMPDWAFQNREMIKSTGAWVELIVLKDYVDRFDELEMEVSKYDCLFIGGGNTFYLRELMKKTRLDEIVIAFMKEGLVYGGASAGAIIAGPTLDHVDLVDDPSLANVVYRDGLRLIDKVIVPHFQHPEYGHLIQQMYDNLVAEGHDVVAITDEQAVIIDGEFVRVK